MTRMLLELESRGGYGANMIEMAQTFSDVQQEPQVTRGNKSCHVRWRYLALFVRCQGLQLHAAVSE